MDSISDKQIMKDGIEAGYMHQLFVVVSDCTGKDKKMRCSAMEQITDVAMSWLDGRIPCECYQVRRMYDQIPGGRSGSTKPLTGVDRVVQDTPGTKRRKKTDFVHKFPDALELEVQQLCHDTIELRIVVDQLTAGSAAGRRASRFGEQDAFQRFAVDRIPGLPVSNREELEKFERNAASLSFRRNSMMLPGNNL